jgi:cytochrome P450
MSSPIEDEPQFSHASALLAAALDPITSFTGQAPDSFDEMLQAGLWLRAYLRELIARRRSEPGDDLMSRRATYCWSPAMRPP